MHEIFMSGDLLVQKINASFDAVSPDTKLEQSIRRSQKSVHHIICQTTETKYVTNGSGISRDFFN